VNKDHVRIRSWNNFKQLVIEKKPPSIVFILEQNGFSPKKELTILKIILLHDKRYYIFLDFPKDDILKETKIPLRKDRNGNLHLDEDEVKEILEEHFQRENIKAYSFWTA
jgi:hypothetical protein